MLKQPMYYPYSSTISQCLGLREKEVAHRLLIGHGARRWFDLAVVFSAGGGCWKCYTKHWILMDFDEERYILSEKSGGFWPMLLKGFWWTKVKMSTKNPGWLNGYGPKKLWSPLIVRETIQTKGLFWQKCNYMFLVGTETTCFSFFPRPGTGRWS